MVQLSLIHQIKVGAFVEANGPGNDSGKPMTAEAAVASLLQNLQAVVRDGEALIQVTASQADAPVAEARTRLAATLEAAKTTCQQLEERTLAAPKVPPRVLPERTGRLLSWALGAGVLIGWLARRK